MTKLIYNEWLKFRASGTYLLSLILAVFIPVLVALFVMMLNVNQAVNHVFLNEYMGMNLRFVLKTISLCFYTYVGADIIAREFIYDTIKSQLTIPITRTGFYLSKLLFGTMVILLIGLLQFAIAVLIALLIIPGGISFSQLYIYGTLFIKANILVLPLMCFSITMVLFFKSKFIPMAVNLVIFMISLIVGKISFYGIIPWSAPYRIIFLEQGDATLLPIGYAYMSLFLFTSLIVTLGYTRIKRMEV